MRRRTVLLAGAATLVVGAGGGAAIVLTSQPGDFSDPSQPFTEETTETAPEATVEKDRFAWPVYGYTKQRTSALDAPRVRPPFSKRWTLSGDVLLEFPPVILGKSLYLLKNNGAVYGIAKRTGAVRWKRKVGDLAASSPAAAKGVVYVTILKRNVGRGGRVVALSAGGGRTLWSRSLPSRSESSPLYDRGTLYFGSENGTVYALDAKDGSVRWKKDVGAAVKAGIALKDGILVVGDYAGKVHALRARNGARVWRSSTSGSRFGLGSGRFYSTPALAYGRVYVGNTDGFVYSFTLRSGKLAWRKKTGGYVYSSPAVANVKGLGPTVFIGSYDKKLYALDARTGRTRWSHNAGGRISGGAVVIGDLVYYSNLARKSTRGLSARTGRTVWKVGRGAFNPVVSDGKWLFLVGYAGLFGLEPKKR